MSEEKQTPPEWTHIVRDAKALFGSLKIGAIKLIDVAKTEIAKRNAPKGTEGVSPENNQSPQQEPAVAAKEPVADKVVTPAAQPAESAKEAAKAFESTDSAAEPKVAESKPDDKK